MKYLDLQTIDDDGFPCSPWLRQVLVTMPMNNPEMFRMQAAFPEFFSDTPPGAMVPLSDLRRRYSVMRNMTVPMSEFDPFSDPVLDTLEWFGLPTVVFSTEYEAEHKLPEGYQRAPSGYHGFVSEEPHLLATPSTTELRGGNYIVISEMTEGGDFFVGTVSCQQVDETR